jgi:hypothetical protein
MRYLGAPRWRYLLFPVAFLCLFPALLVTLLTAGTVRGTRMWLDFCNWCEYE